MRKSPEEEAKEGAEAKRALLIALGLSVVAVLLWLVVALNSLRSGLECFGGCN